MKTNWRRFSWGKKQKNTNSLTFGLRSEVKVASFTCCSGHSRCFSCVYIKSRTASSSSLHHSTEHHLTFTWQVRPLLALSVSFHVIQLFNCLDCLWLPPDILIIFIMKALLLLSVLLSGVLTVSAAAGQIIVLYSHLVGLVSNSCLVVPHEPQSIRGT